MIHSSVGKIVASGVTEWKGEFAVPPKKGPGAAVEGYVVGVRQHTINDSTNRMKRFTVIVMDVRSARRRTYGSDGVEIDVQTPKEKLVRTGYLTLKHEKVNDPNILELGGLAAMTSGGGSGALPDGLYDAGAADLHPKKEARFEFWGEPAQVRAMDLRAGDCIRLKTAGSSMWVESVAKRNDVSPAYAGEKMGWMDKVMDQKEEAPEAEEEEDDGEWD